MLPKGFTRTRRFGGWSNPSRELYQELFAKQLDAAEVPLSPEATEFGPFDDLMIGGEDEQTPLPNPCPKCGSKMIPHRLQEKPSWSETMDSIHRPAWYLRL